MKKAEEKQQQIITGVPALEDFFHRSFISIVAIRESYGLPVKKRGGLPSLDLADWRAWAGEYGVDPDRPTEMKVEQLHAVMEQQMIERTPDAELVGLDKIAQFLGRPMDDVSRWAKSYSDFPLVMPVDGHDKSRRATASTKELRLWLHAHGFSRTPASEHQGAIPGKAQWHND